MPAKLLVNNPLHQVTWVFRIKGYHSCQNMLIISGFRWVVSSDSKGNVFE